MFLLAFKLTERESITIKYVPFVFVSLFQRNMNTSTLIGGDDAEEHPPKQTVWIKTVRKRSDISDPKTSL